MGASTYILVTKAGFLEGGMSIEAGTPDVPGDGPTLLTFIYLYVTSGGLYPQFFWGDVPPRVS